MSLSPKPSSVPRPNTEIDSNSSSPSSSAIPTPVSSTKSQGICARQDFPHVKLRLEIRDLHHAGASILLNAVNASECLETAVANVLRLLYECPSSPTTTVPTTRSVTLILRDMGGVAYTTSTDLDDDHKEIHFSLPYIAGIRPDLRTSEVTGVLTHELVHCFQYNGQETCPGGLIEGIADWVRLRCDLSPPHWRRKEVDRWDQGYQDTAYFLDYLEGHYGRNTVQAINEKLRVQKYVEDKFWMELLGRSVEELWQDYLTVVRGKGQERR
jgi:hypothetical protein